MATALKWRDSVSEAVFQRRFPRPGSASRLHANESPFPPPEPVVAAIRAAAGRVNRYPFGNEAPLIERLAERLGVAPGQILLGAGSNELIYRVIASLAGSGQEIIFPHPSYPSFSGASRASSAVPVPVALTEDGACDLDAMLARVTESTTALIVCQPNNPTGAAVAQPELRRFAAALPRDVLLIVDEAYHEFSAERAGGGTGALAMLTGDRPTLVTRTFSKYYCLAGLRLGYSISSSPDLAQEIRARLGPSGVNGLAVAAAQAALGAEADYATRLAAVITERTRLWEGLHDLGLHPLPSETNFIYCDEPGPDVGGFLLDNGICVRTGDTILSPGHLRITVGERQDTERTLELLREYQVTGGLSRAAAR
jgi:histidinol-phosphate aminotransferase